MSSSLVSLLEYDIPLSAISKLEKKLKIDGGLDEVLTYLKKADLRIFGLNMYEINKIKAIL